eukprot:TRINITY_DN157_c0_g1_i5.p2 TRINITY_DN157_c0_g1~~TRINITY_DN157_c0_g1_i5.p2  ORF type:complete len:106 (+),score=14.36 TRINITY_DN157_c0_g1_i5:213-530(+)
MKRSSPLIFFLLTTFDVNSDVFISLSDRKHKHPTLHILPIHIRNDSSQKPRIQSLRYHLHIDGIHLDLCYVITIPNDLTLSPFLLPAALKLSSPTLLSVKAAVCS